MSNHVAQIKTSCYHCGTECDNSLFFEEKSFCCTGCKSVYEILSQNNLCSYYHINLHPGSTQIEQNSKFEYLDDNQIVTKLLDFNDTKISVVTFYIPNIHCSSCIWLLEQLYKIQTGIINSNVDFLKKQLSITFSRQDISLRQVAELLSRLGYEPLIRLHNVVNESKKKSNVNATLIKKIAVAGFCFGNIMLWSFPEYLGMAAFEQNFKQLFGWLNLLFSIPVFLYSGNGYFQSAYQNLKQKNLNIDFPLALGILVLFIRTAYEILTHTGAGFADTLCGLVFFLLVGKWVQQKTYYHLSFERDYRSYFPIAVNILIDGKEKPTPLADLKVGDRILIRNEEIIPADSILLHGTGRIDFSFVTGESSPVTKILGEMIYAGGKQKGESIELEVLKPVSQSYLTKLWNNETFKKNAGDRFKTFSATISRYFTIGLLTVALGSFCYWMFHDLNNAFGALTAVLIIACPCALALSTPFTMSAALSIFDKNKFYLKNTTVVEQLAQIDTIVFDKTGTITCPDNGKLTFLGEITPSQKILIASLVRHSSHFLSQRIYRSLNISTTQSVINFNEITGQGICGIINTQEIRIGKLDFVIPDNHIKSSNRTEVHVSINKVYIGAYLFDQQYRDQLSETVSSLQKQHQIHLLSGDNSNEKPTLKAIFGEKTPLYFEQNPLNKLEYIKHLQGRGNHVMMLGDGLNDAGALRQSNLGIAITENINNFTPGSDAILDASSFHKLPLFKKFAQKTVQIVHASFIISLIYNVIGLSYAVQGNMSPLVAAVLMPLSTVTIISFTSLATYFAGKQTHLT